MSSSPRVRARSLLDRRRIETGLSQMLGLVRGVIADGSVSPEEARRLALWSRQNPEAASQWPANILAHRLELIFRDGRVDSRERKHLKALLDQIGENSEGVGPGFPLATDLPLTRPAPEVIFEGRTFVFAGDMLYGPWKACEREVVELGGQVERSVTRRTDYVVIGGIAAVDWSQASFGEAVNEVVQYATRGVRIAVISEEHWVAALE